MNISLYIQQQFPELCSKLLPPVEQLSNLRFPACVDAGLWLSPESHITVIFISQGKTLDDSTFELGFHGKQARELAEKILNTKSRYGYQLDIPQLKMFAKKLSENL